MLPCRRYADIITNSTSTLARDALFTPDDMLRSAPPSAAGSFAYDVSVSLRR